MLPVDQHDTHDAGTSREYSHVVGSSDAKAAATAALRMTWSKPPLVNMVLLLPIGCLLALLSGNPLFLVPLGLLAVWFAFRIRRSFAKQFEAMMPTGSTVHTTITDRTIQVRLRGVSTTLDIASLRRLRREHGYVTFHTSNKLHTHVLPEAVFPAHEVRLAFFAGARS